MNQDDFRKLLASGGGGGGGGGRGGRRHGGAQAASGNITSFDADGIRKLSATKSSKKKGNKPPKGANDGDDADDLDSAHMSQSQYRDRAAERRQGATTDMIDADEFKHLDAEQSKFLGGDTAHTHLVKGLDFALLAQLKRERQKLEHATAAEKLKRERGNAIDTHSIDKGNKDPEPTFQTRMGRLVYFHACQHRPLSQDAKVTKSEVFLPGHMYYTFHLLSPEFESIPLAVQRSKEDCPEMDDVVSGLVDEMTIADVRRVLEEKPNSKKVRRKREEKMKEDEEMERGQEAIGEGEVSVVDGGDNDDALKQPPVEDDDDDDFDIFPDAGEYVPAYLREEENPTTESDTDKVPKGYFTDLSASITEAEKEAKETERQVQAAWKETLAKAAAAQLQVEKDEAMRARVAKLAAIQDSYGDYQMGGDEESDEDDEAQSSKKRKGAADAKKSGGAVGEVDGEEKTRRKKQKQGNRLENDLKKINKLMESKS